MDLSTSYAGIPLAHPFIAASTGATRNDELAARCEEAGYSAVVLKSVQEEMLMRHNPFPRFRVLHLGIPGYSATTFYSYEQAYEGGIDEYAETVRKAKKRTTIPIIASINCITPERWGEYAVACEQAGADALEIVPSCPTGQLIREGSDNHSLSVAALRLCKSLVTIPVIPKMSSQVANMIITARCLDEAGADGLTIFNRPTGLEIDIESMAPILHGGFAGHGGPWALTAVLRWIVDIAPLVKAEISATNGISCWQDGIKCLLAGARSVQIGTLMYLEGFNCVQVLVRDLNDYLERKKIDRASDLVGIAARRLLRMNQYDRRQRYFAVTVSERCVSCGKCRDVCIYDAIEYSDSGPSIDARKCDGCGLCVSVCGNRRAIEIHPRD